MQGYLNSIRDHKKQFLLGMQSKLSQAVLKNATASTGRDWRARNRHRTDADTRHRSDRFHQVARGKIFRWVETPSARHDPLTPENFREDRRYIRRSGCERR